MFKKSPKKDLITMLVLVFLVVVGNLAWNMAGHLWPTTLFTIEIAAVVVLMLLLILKRSITGAYKNKPAEEDTDIQE
ncbi:MAG: hypothetical protein PUD55_04865 [Firmicutes bacterium]|nr:hypothetical protein [Bacillota bacterium]